MDFFNRDRELSELRTNFRIKNAVLVIGPRRMGKTTLLQEFIAKNKIPGFIFNCELVDDLPDFYQQYSNKIFKSFFRSLDKSKEIMDRFKNLFSGTITINEDGTISSQLVDVSKLFDKEKNINALEDTLNMAEESCRRNEIHGIIALDEFQALLAFDENIAKKIRAIIQSHKNITYIFSGSRADLLGPLFADKKKPFYGFADVLNVNAIEKNEYIAKQKKYLKFIAAETFNTIYEYCHGITYYVNVTINRINETHRGKGLFKDEDFRWLVDKIIFEHDRIFETIYHRLSSNNKKTMKLLANEEGSYFAEENCRKYNIKIATLGGALKSLIKEQLVEYQNKNYYIDDPFFKEWIRRAV